jgi:Ala-tRNA(Pro) deacylase
MSEKKTYYNKSNLLNDLNKLKIPFTIKEHLPFYTVKDSELNRKNMLGIHTKNIFLKNKKNQFFLFSCYENQIVDIKRLSKSLNIGNLSFAKEEKLNDILGVLPGSVSPFGLLNDTENLVSFYIDSKILKSEYVNFHPLENTSTVTIKSFYFLSFLLEKNKIVNTFNFNTYSLMD